MAKGRWVVLTALLASLSAVGWAVLDFPGSERVDRLQEEAYTRRLGDALIRQGISLYQKGDYPAAITAWERYVRMAPPNADTQSIREMIGEATAQRDKPGPQPKPAGTKNPTKAKRANKPVSLLSVACSRWA
jgi:outer membrane protein assembly factor BamD (BamD/ComL family)